LNPVGVTNKKASLLGGFFCLGTFNGRKPGLT